MAQGRSLWGNICKNFINSLKPRKIWGELIGKDSLGTEYYESKDVLRGRRPSRWFVPVDPKNSDVEKPPEWEAWLRHTRKVPPTEEEIQLNIQIRLAVIEKAKKLESPKTKASDEIKTFDKPGFPVYEEYTSNPTEAPKGKK